jgi:hypothetical protein
VTDFKAAPNYQKPQTGFPVWSISAHSKGRYLRRGSRTSRVPSTFTTKTDVCHSFSVYERNCHSTDPHLKLSTISRSTRPSSAQSNTNFSITYINWSSLSKWYGIVQTTNTIISGSFQLVVFKSRQHKKGGNLRGRTSTTAVHCINMNSVWK